LAHALLEVGGVNDRCLPAPAPMPSVAQRLAHGPVVLGCRQEGEGWSCECPATSAVAGAASPPSAGPSFQVEVAAAGAGGSVRLRATGRGAGGAGSATLAELVAPAEAGSMSHWRRMPGSWRDFPSP
jgi:hypothetical protein